jgi:DNA repair protein RadC
MGNWYPVVKTKKGHRYIYLQQTYREGGHVRTRNRYIGPAADSASGSSSAGATSGPAGAGRPAAGTPLVSGALGFGKAMLDQFDAGRWGSDTAQQLGLGTPKQKTPGKRAKRGVTTTVNRNQQHQTMDKQARYGPVAVSSSGRRKSGALAQMFSRIPEGITDPRGYVVKRNGKLFPTGKLTVELRSYLDIQLAGDGSIIDGLHINKTRFTQDVLLQPVSRHTDNTVRSAVTTTQTTDASRASHAGSAANPARSGFQTDAHRKYFTNVDIRITRPLDAVRLCREMLATEDAIDRDKEHYYAIHLNTRSKVTLIEVVSVGTLQSSLVHPRETFRRAIAEGSASIIIAHNHPSGEVDPSDNDTQVTKLMFDAGEIIGIDVLDHVVFSDSKAFSFRDNKNIEQQGSVSV